MNVEGSEINLKLMSNKPYVTSKFNNGNMIIYINNNDTWLEYLSSNRLYHRSLLGSIKDSILNWDEWFLPKMERSAYYAAASLVGRIDCDIDYDTYECRVCYTKSHRFDGYWSSFSVHNVISFSEMDSELNSIYEWRQCGFTIRDALALHIVKLLHADSSAQNLCDETIPRRKASGNFCVCAKPKLTNYFDSYKYINGNDNDIEEANNRYCSLHNNKKTKKQQLIMVYMLQKHLHLKNKWMY